MSEPMSHDPTSPDPAPLPARLLTWSALIAHCAHLARAAVALPEDAEGDAWRASMPSLVMLQALCLALNEAPSLPPDQRALARDRAAVLLDEHRERLQRAWSSTPMPAGIEELLHDAAAALETEAVPAKEGRKAGGRNHMSRR